MIVKNDKTNKTMDLITKYKEYYDVSDSEILLKNLSQEPYYRDIPEFQTVDWNNTRITTRILIVYHSRKNYHDRCDRDF